MPTTLLLDLDVTGVNINNRITNEVHTLSPRPTRSIAPRYGVFYADSVIVMDGVRTLTRGIDFQIVELHQESTLKYGKELSSVILILDPSVSSAVTITYQALGGYYANDSSTIASLYQTVVTDNRPIDWVNIFNKPEGYNPTLHRHLLEDVYGFEPVVDYLERIKTAITLGQTEVLVSSLRAFLTKFDHRDLPKVRPSNKIVQYDALLYFLTRRKIMSDTWVDVKECIWYKGDTSKFQIDTSAYPIGTKFYWELYKPYGSVALFYDKKGVVLGNGGIVEASVYVPANNTITDNPLYIGIKLDPEADEFTAVTYQIELKDHPVTTEAVGFMLDLHTQATMHETSISYICSDDDRRLYYMLSYK